MVLNYYTIVIGFIFGILLFYRLPMLTKPNGKETEKIKISIIIPARNEGKNLPKILSDLKNQTYNIHEIICVDDNSEDDTSNVIDNFGVVKVSVDELPKGWKGKTWACQSGAKKAVGDVLIFIDADVRLSENAVESLAEKYCKSKSPVSVQPYHTVKKQHEFFSLFFNLVEICSTGMSFIGLKKGTGFYGPILLIPKELFDKHGGYEVVKNDVAEDFSLGIFYNKKGIDIDLLLGADAIKFRMYPKSFGSVVEGWSKNFSSGSIAMQGWLLIVVILWVAGLTALTFELVNTLMNDKYLIFAILSIIYLINTILICRVSKAIGSYPLYVCVFYPIYLIVFQGIFVYSIIATFVLKSTTWKGRKL